MANYLDGEPNFKETKDYRNALAMIATFSQDEKSSKAAAETLQKYNDTWHFCYEWDGLFICDEDDEYQHCQCLPKEEAPQ